MDGKTCTGNHMMKIEKYVNNKDNKDTELLCEGDNYLGNSEKSFIAYFSRLIFY